jgi:hypothetical protein
MSVKQLAPKKMIFDDVEVVTKSEAYAPIAPQLAAFKEHRGKLLDHLRKANQSSAGAKPLNEKESWDDLVLLAKLYFWAEVDHENRKSTAERFNQLQRLGRALLKARTLADQMMREDTAIDLFRGWFADTGVPLDTIAAPLRPSPAQLVLRHFKSAINALAKLENASFNAAVANSSSSESGRSPLLPSDCIQGLARVYQSSTGCRPGRGLGPFADFVSAFIKAIHKQDFEFSPYSVPGAIQEAHNRSMELRGKSFLGDEQWRDFPPL